ncbi:hypothetical protein I316_04931 [Kwoniella heveanensis BCC8398]|uniref:Uncharacterized protein n=1 Tax=Kwoniella heveanensis BCC8398 TaxID=1296120 RepID=A0A1B9GR15_9TREE|nr:hypothetical protein I316_04931 [Kwoniella heveanensis BCC8398]
MSIISLGCPLFLIQKANISTIFLSGGATSAFPLSSNPSVISQQPRDHMPTSLGVLRRCHTLLARKQEIKSWVEKLEYRIFIYTYLFWPLNQLLSPVSAVLGKNLYWRAVGGGGGGRPDFELRLYNDAIMVTELKTSDSLDTRDLDNVHDDVAEEALYINEAGRVVRRGVEGFP